MSFERACLAFLLVALTACRPASQATDPATLSGTFFGASQDGRAWLFFIDRKGRWGSLDIPPQPLELCELRADSSQVTMRWAPGYEDVPYDFRGQWTGSELIGEMEGPLAKREPGRRTISTPLRARRVSGPPAGADSGRGGYYANVLQTSEGELGGTEFLLIDAPGQPVALLTFYEGSAGEPWAAQELVVYGDTLRFKIRRDREDAFEAVFEKKRTLSLSSRTLGFSERLSKRATVAELAHGTWKPGCPDSLRIN